MISRETRDKVRRAFDYRCAYCGVSEDEAGCELEIDHFRPRVYGGSDRLSNLVYCCAACNRFKGDFWPAHNPLKTELRLLHPKRDDLALHLKERKDGYLQSLTATGAFHLERLQLNRVQLIAVRLHRKKNARLEKELNAALKRQRQTEKQLESLNQTLLLLQDELERMVNE